MQRLSQHLADPANLQAYRKWAESPETVKYLEMALAEIEPHPVDPSRPMDTAMMLMQGGIERGRRHQINRLLSAGVAAEVEQEKHDYGMRESLTELGWTPENIEKYMQEEANRG